MSRLSLRSPLVQAVMRRPTAQPLPRCLPQATSASGAARTFSHFPCLRPSPLASNPTAFRARQTTATTSPLFTPSTTSTSTATSTTPDCGLLDLVPKSAISAHPAFSGFGASQIRCGPRPTMSGATRLIQKRRHGFLSRVKTQNGRKTIARRRAKGRKKLGH